MAPRTPARPLSPEDRPDPPALAPAAARDADEVVRARDHAERGVLRPVSRVPDPDAGGPRDVAAARRRARGPPARAVDGRAEDEVPRGGGDRGEPVLGQQPGPLLAPRARRAVGRRRHWQRGGAPLPMLIGFPARLVVPGWYATYWVKNLSDITVADKPFERFWMKPAYRIPDNPCGCVEPGTAPKATVPIHRMNVRSFLVSPEPGARLAAGRPVTLKGIAFDGGYGIREVEVSDDGGSTWRRVSLGRDLGPCAFREGSAAWTPPRAGAARVMVRAFNRIGESQGTEPLWNPAGYLRNVIESVEYPVG